jgi:hypothetical protein
MMRYDPPTLIFLACTAAVYGAARLTLDHYDPEAMPNPSTLAAADQPSHIEPVGYTVAPHLDIAALDDARARIRQAHSTANLASSPALAAVALDTLEQLQREDIPNEVRRDVGIAQGLLTAAVRVGNGSLHYEWMLRQASITLGG